MAELATLSQDRTLQLPVEIAEHFNPSDKFIVWMDKDMLHLKRLSPSPLKVVADAPLGILCHLTRLTTSYMKCGGNDKRLLTLESYEGVPIIRLSDFLAQM